MHSRAQEPERLQAMHDLDVHKGIGLVSLSPGVRPEHTFVRRWHVWCWGCVGWLQGLGLNVRERPCSR